MLEAKLSRELLEAVLDPEKERSDTAHQIQTIHDNISETLSDDPLIAGMEAERAFDTGQWLGWQSLIEDSPLLQSVVDEACARLSPTAETAKGEDMPLIRKLIVRIYGPGEAAEFVEHMPPEFYFRNRVMTQLEKFFRAGWEARGMVEEAEQLKKLMD
jgi:hypothetical protein